MARQIEKKALKPSLVKTCYWLLAFFIVAFTNATECHSQAATILLPADGEHATLWTSDPPKLSNELTGYFEFSRGEEIGVAAGEVQIPTDSFIGIEVDAKDGYENYLAELPASGIHSLVLRNATLSDSLINSIERIESLRVLKFYHCAFADLNAGKLTGLPQLQTLSFLQFDDAIEFHEAIVPWAAKCPKLQNFYNGKNLSSKEIMLFQHHQAPLFMNVSLDANAIEIIEALGQVPNLVAVVADVSADTPPLYHQNFKELKQVELLSFHGGRFDREFLDSLSKLKRLRSLYIQGTTQIRNEFIENLNELKNLEGISFNTRLSQKQKEDLPRILVTMDKVSTLPTLKDVTSTQLETLSKRSNIKRLTIFGLGEGATETQLAEAISSNFQIEWLDLSNLDITPEMADAICKCKNLKFLSLDSTHFDGQLFRSPEQLQNLTGIYLSIATRPVGLSALARLPRLESIQISFNSLHPDDWSFISKIKRLDSIMIDDGYCDDSIVKWLKPNKNLRSFITKQNCFMTDRGVDALSRCTQFETLSIEGFISASSIEKLEQLPNLQRLSVCSDLPSKAEADRLRKQFSGLESFELRKFRPAAGKSIVGADGNYRQVPDSGRIEIDKLEGLSLEEILGPKFTEELQKELKGKVVMVEFWGTWCRPCLKYVPELNRLHSQYCNHEFQILTVHSQEGAETAGAYLKQHPKPWPNLIDEEGSLEKAFAVPSFPSAYIFGRDGLMKVAVPYRYGLDRTLEKLLKIAD